MVIFVFITQEEIKSSLKIYPNPANDLLYIKSENIKENEKIEIRNMIGELVYESAATGLNELNASSWPLGTYVVKCGSSISKLMIAK
ncbi:MAG: T9SS type A sorting domain-containing protein [Bacteroidota bacterium]